VVGLSLYIFALYILISYFAARHDQNLLYGLALWLAAVNLFILGHAIEGSVKAMTAIVVFKYVKSIVRKNRL
jgi:hypothetical protein